MYALLTLRGLTVRRKFFKISLYFFTTLFLLFSVGFGALLYRLHKAPISLEKYIPTLVDIIAPADGSKISIESALLTWKSWRHPFNVRVTGFSVADKDGASLGRIQEMNATFSLFALMHGIVAPRTISIYRPDIRLTVNSDEHTYTDAPADDDDNQTRILFKNLMTRVEQEHYLRHFSLVDARIKITDVSRNAVWNIPTGTVSYSKRRGRHKLTGSFSIETAGKPLTAAVSGSWKNKAKTARLEIAVRNIDITKSRAARKYEFLRGISVPLSLTADLKLNLSKIKSDADLFLWREIVKSLDFSLTGRQGSVVLPASIGGTYDVKSLSVAGSWFDAGNTLVVSDIDVEMQSGAAFHAFFAANNLGKSLDSQNWSGLNAELKADARNLSMERVPDYWPQSAAPDVHDWVKNNIKAGFVPTGGITMQFGGNRDGITLNGLDASARIENARVTYMDDMPAVEDVKADLHFTKNDIDITLIDGHTDGVFLQKGMLSFAGLTRPATMFVLDTDLETESLSDVFKILSSPALKITQAAFINPANISGGATGCFKLTFPMTGGPINPADVRVSVTADAKDVTLSHYLIDALNIQSTGAHLDLTEKEMTLTGSGKMRTGDMNFTLYQSFDFAPDVTTDLKASAVLTNEARADLNIDFLTPPNIAGDIPAEFALRFFKDKTGLATVDLDLTPANIDLGVIGWKKAAGVAGKGTAEIRLTDYDFASVPKIELTDALHTRIRAKIDFSAAHTLKKIDISPISTGRTHAQARARFLKKSIRFDMTGAALDWASLMKAATPEQSVRKQANAKQTDWPAVVINAAFDRIFLSAAGTADDIAFAGIYKNGGWRKMNGTGSVGEQKMPFVFSLSPSTAPDEYTFSLSTRDAGYALNVLDYISTVKGGTLQVKSTYVPGKGIDGLVEIKDFYLEDQPVLTRLLRLTSFTGIYDTLTGQGLHFNKAEIPYKVNQTAMSFKDALITGSSLGITLNGLYNRETGFLDLYGSLLPFYGVNSLPGKIPLIGKLFVGEKGGGLIGVAYSVKGLLPNPEISVNPLSALAPGAARNLFN